MAKAQDDAIIPPDAVYLGTDMGGEFVRLARRDIVLEDGRILPAFDLEIYAAYSTGADYGTERIGALVYTGLGIYVPPQDTLHGLVHERYDPPSVAYILGTHDSPPNATVNNDILYVQLPHQPGDPVESYVAMVMPVPLEP